MADFIYDPEYGCNLYLARQTGPMAVELVDGGHDLPEDVARAAKLQDRIFGDNGPWVMVQVHEIPTVEVSINEEAAADCARMVEEFGS